VDSLALEAAVWTDVLDLLSDPAHLERIAEAKMARSGPQEAGALDDLPTVERRLAAKRRELVDGVASAISAGFDDATMRAVTAQIKADVDALEARVADLTRSEADRLRQSAAVDRLSSLAQDGLDRLTALDGQSRAQIYKLLGLKVRVLGYGDRHTSVTYELEGNLVHELLEPFVALGAGNGGNPGGAAIPRRGPRPR
jgi:hypothetical protein